MKGVAWTPGTRQQLGGPSKEEIQELVVFFHWLQLRYFCSIATYYKSTFKKKGYYYYIETFQASLIDVTMEIWFRPTQAWLLFENPDRFHQWHKAQTVFFALGIFQMVSGRTDTAAWLMPLVLQMGLKQHLLGCLYKVVVHHGSSSKIASNIGLQNSF